MAEIAEKITKSIENTTKGAGLPELYPVDSAVARQTLDNVAVPIYKETRFNGDPTMAKVEGVNTPIAIKGIATQLGPTTGKFVVLTANEDRPWGPFNGKSGVVKKGDTKAFIVV